eukprot:1189283-Amphidinium_carterae.1
MYTVAVLVFGLLFGSTLVSSLSATMVEFQMLRNGGGGPKVLMEPPPPSKWTFLPIVLTTLTTRNLLRSIIQLAVSMLTLWNCSIRLPFDLCNALPVPV